MPTEDNQDEMVRNTSRNSNLRVKRSRRRIYESVPEGTPPADTPKEESLEDQQEVLRRKIRWMQAKNIVKNHMLGAMGAGMIPFPVIDAAAVSGVQLKMLHSLSRHYDISFMENRAKAFIAVLIGGIGPSALAFGALGMLLKTLPGIGAFLGIIKMSAFSAASVYAVGMVFIQHFESGGTFLDFKPEKVNRYYVQKFQEGRKIPPGASDDDKH